MWPGRGQGSADEGPAGGLTRVVPAASRGGAPPPGPVHLGELPLLVGLTGEGVGGQVANLQARIVPQKVTERHPGGGRARAPRSREGTLPNSDLPPKASPGASEGRRAASRRGFQLFPAGPRWALPTGEPAGPALLSKGLVLECGDNSELVGRTAPSFRVSVGIWTRLQDSLLLSEGLCHPLVERDEWFHSGSYGEFETMGADPTAPVSLMSRYSPPADPSSKLTRTPRLRAVWSASLSPLGRRCSSWGSWKNP